MESINLKDFRYVLGSLVSKKGYLFSGGLDVLREIVDNNHDKFYEEIEKFTQLFAKELNEFWKELLNFYLEVAEFFCQKLINGQFENFSYNEITNEINTIFESCFGSDELRDIIYYNARKANIIGQKQALREINLDETSLVNLNMEGMADLRKQVSALANKIVDNMVNKIKIVIINGVKKGLSYNEMSENIKKVYKKGINISVKPKKINGKDMIPEYTYPISSKNWSEVVARTEIMKFANNGRLMIYKLGKEVDGVMVGVPEDGRSCPICLSLEAILFDLNVAEYILPLHTNCRCTWIPYIKNEKAVR